jgi:hypothetical protein
MSGADLPYHLRPNKAIERNLFVELLTRVGRVKNISAYEYIGFGGPMLEDYKALHATLRISQMHSIERNENTFKRQNFNLPAKFVKLHWDESEEFFRKHSFSPDGTIVWLDFTEPGASKLKTQLDQFKSVVEKLGTFDVAKITLNASATALVAKPEDGQSLDQARLRKLRNYIGEYLPSGIDEDDLLQNSYPATLLACVRQCVSSLSEKAGGRCFRILSAFEYADGQRMLTVTGIVFENGNLGVEAFDKFLYASRLKFWPYCNLDWQKPERIEVPVLTAKERMHLDEMLPMTTAETDKTQLQLLLHLGFKVGSERSLANYAKFYRVYPQFSRVLL